MKTIKYLTLHFWAAILLTACGGSGSTGPADRLLSDLQASVDRGAILFGQQDAYMYGHTWKASDINSLDRTDVGDVCGMHPAVLGLDLGGIELGSEHNLDGNSFDFMRRAALGHYAQGGILTFSWHPRNPLTGGDSWDVSSDKAVASVLEGGEKHEFFMGWLSLCADYLETFRDADGNLVPMIFRPWHEHTGSWFWWGQNLCTTEEYLALWKMTYDYMTLERHLGNIVWAYSPGAGPDSTGYMERYPGDRMVDILGLDCYQYGELPASNASYAAQLKDALFFMTELGQRHGKLIALTETGVEGLPYPQWWTEVFYPAIKGYPIAYVLVWRNAWDKPGHFYAPWPGQESAEDFRALVKSGGVRMLQQ